jgi:hypothetical protein
MPTKENRYYVRAEKDRKGRVIAYTVNDCVGGRESEHARYDIAEGVGTTATIALYLANQDRDDRNAGIE